MMIELSFSSEVPERRNIVFLKYLDVTASAIGFWLFGFEISNINPQFIDRVDINSANTSYINRVVVIEDDITCNHIVPYIVWFFKFGFASNTARYLRNTMFLRSGTSLENESSIIMKPALIKKIIIAHINVQAAEASLYR